MVGVKSVGTGEEELVPIFECNGLAQVDMYFRSKSFSFDRVYCT